MKKQQQIIYNRMVIMAWSEFSDTFTKGIAKSIGRLRTCSAWVWETEQYIVLESYNTIIAFIDKESGELYDVLRLVYGFTATSAQHIAKFKKDYLKYWCVEYRYCNV